MQSIVIKLNTHCFVLIGCVFERANSLFKLFGS